jgi:hypothetical protein
MFLPSLLGTPHPMLIVTDPASFLEARFWSGIRIAERLLGERQIWLTAFMGGTNSCFLAMCCDPERFYWSAKLSMPSTITKLWIFVASLGDVGAEQDHFSTVVAELNTKVAGFKQMALELVPWETHASSGMGRAQRLINTQLGFWHRREVPPSIQDLA